MGASSARALVASALAGGQLSFHEVTRLLDEGGQSLRFSRQLLASTFENVDAGISVVDAEMNLIAWNSRYEEIFRYPPDLLRVGAPVADLIRDPRVTAHIANGLRAHNKAYPGSSTRIQRAILMAEPAPSTPQQFEEFLKRERLRYQAVVKLSGAKVE